MVDFDHIMVVPTIPLSVFYVHDSAYPFANSVLTIPTRQ